MLMLQIMVFFYNSSINKVGLFYVALTKTRNNVYLLSYVTEPSDFVEDFS